MEISGKNIIVTGALGSLGCSIAEALGKQQACVYGVDCISSEKDNYYKVDVTDSKQVSHILSQIERVDVLINCCGMIYSEPMLNLLEGKRHSEESWNRVIDSNLTSCFVMSSCVAEKMARSRTKGVIINFSSISAQGNMGQIAYSAAKAGIEAFTKAAAKELGLLKIRMCAIAPGFIDTESTDKSLSESMISYWKKNTPLRRFGKIEDVISAVEFIIKTDYLTGEIIHLDGGLTI